MKDHDITMVARMTKYMANGIETAEDIRYVENHLDGYNTFLLEMSTHKLVEAGIDRDLAETMLGTISHVSKMLGAANFNDYARTALMFEE